jgi:F0F1-type ATP synthase epsilon subunit
LTPDETLLDLDKVAWVHVKLTNGKGVTIWPAHAPLLAETIAETMRYEDQSGAQRIELPPGTLQVCDNVVTCFLDRAIGDSSRDQAAVGSDQFDRLADTLLSALPRADV